MKTRKFLITLSIVALVVSSFPTKAEAAISNTGSNTASGTGTTASITHGLTINSGDVVVAVIHANSGAQITDNNGATPFVETFEEDTAATAADGRYMFAYRVSAGSEPSSYSWTLDASVTWTIIVRVFSGVDTSSVWDVAPAVGTRTGSSEDGTTATAPSVTINTAGAMGLVWVLTDGTVTYSDPTNSYAGEVEKGGVGSSQVSYSRTFVGTGLSGTTAVTINTSQDWVAFQIALKSGVNAPTVTTVAATGVGVTSATLNGEITATGGANSTVRGFAWGTNSTLSSASATTTETGDFGTGTFSQMVSGLLAGVTYYYRAYATNSAGNGYGTILNFTAGTDTGLRRTMRLFEGFKIKVISGRIILHQSQ